MSQLLHIVSNLKSCKACRLIKPFETFAKKKSNKDGRAAICKDCHNKASRGKYKGNEGSNREKNLKKKYGINESIYQKMFSDQRGKCKICGTHQIDLKHKLQVDHCHETGKVRGLLCFDCNRGLGSFKDEKIRLTIALQYLEEYEC